MKKLLTVTAVLLLACGLQAQTRRGAHELTIGPKAGLNVTNISNIDDNKNKISFLVGGFVEWKVSDFFAVQPELLYSRQGYRWKNNGTKGKFRVNYLNIPILAKLYVLDGLSVDLGPQLGIALNGKNKWKNNGHTEKDKFKHLNTVEVSFALGLSYNWDHFMFSARYNLGLSNVIDKGYNHVGNNKNHVFQLSVGYRFSDLF